MPLETEAKFIVRDRTGFLSLKNLTSLPGFGLSAASYEEVRDTYLDTKDRKYLQAGYACRLREREYAYFITLKSLASQGGDVQVRTELEELIEDPARATRVELWPQGEARELATRIGRGMVLGALCELRQARWKRKAFAGEGGGGEQADGSMQAGREQSAPLFELSLDEVRLPGLLYFVEIELLTGGNMEDLGLFIKKLKKVVPLEVDRMSKLEHALRVAGIPLPPGVK